jgi:hypothetical protein
MRRPPNAPRTDLPLTWPDSEQNQEPNSGGPGRPRKHDPEIIEDARRWVNVRGNLKVPSGRYTRPQEQVLGVDRERLASWLKNARTRGASLSNEDREWLKAHGWEIPERGAPKTRSTGKSRALRGPSSTVAARESGAELEAAAQAEEQMLATATEQSRRPAPGPDPAAGGVGPSSGVTQREQAALDSAQAAFANAAFARAVSDADPIADPARVAAEIVRRRWSNTPVFLARTNHAMSAGIWRVLSEGPRPSRRALDTLQAIWQRYWERADRSGVQPELPPLHVSLSDPAVIDQVARATLTQDNPETAAAALPLGGQLFNAISRLLADPLPADHPVTITTGDSIPTVGDLVITQEAARLLGRGIQFTWPTQQGDLTLNICPPAP